MVRTRYSGTAAKAGGKQRKQTSSFGYGSLRPTRKAARSATRTRNLPHRKPSSSVRRTRLKVGLVQIGPLSGNTAFTQNTNLPPFFEGGTEGGCPRKQG